MAVYGDAMGGITDRSGADYWERNETLGLAVGPKISPSHWDWGPTKSLPMALRSLRIGLIPGDGIGREVIPVRDSASPTPHIHPDSLH